MVSRQGTRLAALLAVATLTFVLAACGGSDSGSSSPTSPPATTTQTGSSNGSQKGGGKSGKDSGEGKRGADDNVATAPLRISGGGSGQFRVKGGDNSIQDFGEEASGAELEAAANVLHDFYVSRARGEWGRACANLSKTVADQLEQLAERAKQGGKADCPTTLAAITPDLPPKVAYETTIVDASSLRVDDDRGFLIYRGGEGVAYAIVLSREDDRWKVGALAGIPLQ